MMKSLKRGDSGEEVKAVQRILKKVGLFDGELGGNFGPLTEQAVVGFQLLHNGPKGRRLPTTGTTTDATWWALQNLKEARATPPELKPGASGDKVKVLQRLLKSRGVFSGSVRGNYRDLTEGAVKAFQENHAGQDGKPLSATGVADGDTWWALLNPAAAKAGSDVSRPTLKHGDKGPLVVELQKLLKKRADFKGATKGNFLKLTEESVRYFQSTHVGPDGQFLDADGIVGSSTWWALRNSSGPPQASGLSWDIPDGIGPLRRKQLEIVIRERQAKVRERPDDTNWGGGVEKYRGNRQAWCCYFWSWGTKQATGRYPLGAKLGACRTAWKRAQDQGVAHNKGDYIPIPGDAFVILRRDNKNKLTGRGHIGFVLRVEVAGGSAVAIDTVEGNTGNRVKVGRRLLSERELVGFINQYPPDAQPVGWQTGLGKTDIGGSKSTL
jgi:peptidoglycan hydrolase-like protein with peptidoglycan-binding domain